MNGRANTRRRKSREAQPPLSVARPDLMGEWHPKNELTPEQVTAGSSRRVLWECSKCKTQWCTTVSNRTYRGSGCPACAARDRGRVLLDKNPWVAVEFDVEANGTPPDQVSAYSTMLAWWHCPDCDHRWQAQVVSRATRNGRCPLCATRRRAGRRNHRG